MLIQLLRKKPLEIIENIYFQLPSLYLITFFIPFLIQGPQLLTGTLINFLLILSISQFKLVSIIPLFFLPSLSVYIHGLLFAGATNFFTLLIPAIALGNALYVFSFKNLGKIIVSSSVRVIIAAIIKSATIFLVTLLLVRLSGLPEALLNPMGIIQFVTASIGGLIAVATLTATKNLIQKENIC